jgi:hypothetical protein
MRQVPRALSVRLNRRSSNTIFFKWSELARTAGRNGAMSKPFVIETRAEPAGIVLRQDDTFRRHATLRGLDKRQFAAPRLPG